MATDDIDGGSGGDVQPVPLGVRVTFANTPDKIRALLPDGGRGWFLQKPNEYNSFLLSASRTTKIIKRKSAKEMTSCTRADGDTVMVFVLATRKSDTGGSGGINADSDSMSGLTDVEKLTIDMANKSAVMEAYYRGEKPLQPYRSYAAGFDQDENPSVLITTPKKGTVIIRGLRGIDIDGTTLNTTNLELTWSGDDVGSESMSSGWDKWNGLLPVRAGD